jgi:hypothetical protein
LRPHLSAVVDDSTWWRNGSSMGESFLTGLRVPRDASAGL